MYPGVKFSVELVDGDRLGHLVVPYNSLADWLNFLLSPHYGIQLLAAEQGTGCVHLSFFACEGVYDYLQVRVAVGKPYRTATRMAIAG